MSEYLLEFLDKTCNKSVFPGKREGINAAFPQAFRFSCLVGGVEGGREERRPGAEKARERAQ